MSDDIVTRIRLYANASIDGGWASVFRSDLTAAADEIERIRHELDGARLAYRGASYDRDRMRSERDEARLQTGRILNEIDCRIEHGAESGGHLEAIRNLFKEATDGK